MGDTKQEDFIGQLNRLDEFGLQFVAERDYCIKNKMITPRLRIITQDFLIRCSLILDHLFFDFWKNKTISYSNNTARKVYFPIFNNNERFSENMKAYGLFGNSQILEFFESLQPYKSPQNSWLTLVKIHGVQRKHIEVMPVSKGEKNQLVVADGNFRAIDVRAGGQIIIEDTATFNINGKQITGAQIKSSPTKSTTCINGLTVEKTVWESFEIIEGELSLDILLLFHISRENLIQIYGKIEQFSNVAKDQN